METTKEVLIHSTRDYSVFRRLKGNRNVTNSRVAIIKESIASVGYISNPIIVNETMEVIDGQGRLEALRQLDLPVEYRVINGIGIEECRAMNLKPTAWSVADFVDSFAEYGNDNFVWLKSVKKSYGFSYPIIYAICKGVAHTGGEAQSELRRGTFNITKERREQVESTLEYLKRFKDIQPRVGGRADMFYSIVAWLSELDGVDKERLCVSMHQQVKELHPVGQIIPTLREISDVYNKGYAKKNRKYFDYEYRR